MTQLDMTQNTRLTLTAMLLIHLLLLFSAFSNTQEDSEKRELNTNRTQQSLTGHFIYLFILKNKGKTLKTRKREKKVSPHPLQLTQKI